MGTATMGDECCRKGCLPKGDGAGDQLGPEGNLEQAATRQPEKSVAFSHPSTARRRPLSMLPLSK